MFRSIYFQAARLSVLACLQQSCFFQCLPAERPTSHAAVQEHLSISYITPGVIDSIGSSAFIENTSYTPRNSRNCEHLGGCSMLNSLTLTNYYGKLCHTLQGIGWTGEGGFGQCGHYFQVSASADGQMMCQQCQKAQGKDEGVVGNLLKKASSDTCRAGGAYYQVSESKCQCCWGLDPREVARELRPKLPQLCQCAGMIKSMVTWGALNKDYMASLKAAVYQYNLIGSLFCRRFVACCFDVIDNGEGKRLRAGSPSFTAHLAALGHDYDSQTCFGKVDSIPDPEVAAKEDDSRALDSNATTTRADSKTTPEVSDSRAATTGADSKTTTEVSD